LTTYINPTNPLTVKKDSASIDNLFYLNYFYPNNLGRIMSLNKKYELTIIAKHLCRKLRKNSTPAEAILWNILRNRGFLNLKFYRQHPIFYDLLGPESFFIADFYCHQLKLVIELDGNYHLYRINEDNQRTTIINLLGIKVIRFSNDDVTDRLNIVLSAIEKVKEEMFIKDG
jgi:very-short-patch-repair endonuclease